MKKRTQVIYFISMVTLVGNVIFLEGKDKRNIKRSVRSQDEKEKEQSALYKKTRVQIKSAREQYKKQLSRLAELLTQVDSLGRGSEEHEATMRDLRDFFGALGDIYTTVVDTITGKDELKKQIKDLQTINTQLLSTIQSQRIEIKKRSEHEENLAQALMQERIAHDDCSKQCQSLEQEKSEWLNYLYKLESCSRDMQEEVKQLNKEKFLTEDMLNRLCEYTFAVSPQSM